MLAYVVLSPYFSFCRRVTEVYEEYYSDVIPPSLTRCNPCLWATKWNSFLTDAPINHYHNRLNSSLSILVIIIHDVSEMH